MLFPVCPLLHT
jgi:hypothetical protein